MKLRWKYFIVLLVASLTPMLAVTFISQNASKKLAGTLSEQTQKELMETVRREIVSATENYALITRRSKSSVEFALAALVRETGIVQNLPEPVPEPVYFDTDFEDPSQAPDDLVSSQMHAEILEDGRLVPKQVSYRHPNFLLAPDTQRSAMDDTIARLTRLKPALAGIYAEMAEAILWIYASTEVKPSHW